MCLPPASQPSQSTRGGAACSAIRASPTSLARPEVPSTAVVAVGHRLLVEAAREAIAVGVRGLVVPGAGAEAGAEAKGVGKALGELARATGTAVLGTNCMGFVRPGGPSLWIGALPEGLRGGSVSVIAHSGSVAEGLVALGGRVGFRAVVSSGSEVARDVADFASYFAKDPGTSAIGLFLETVRRPKALSAALVQCAEANKPVVCLKVGRSAAAARLAVAHTGALVGSARACSAWLGAHGVIEVSDLPDLVETLEVLGRRRRPRGRRLAAVSESGGEAELLADHAEAAGLELVPLGPALAEKLESEFPNFVKAENPLDAWAVDAPEAVYPRSLELLAGSGAYDIVVAQVDLTQFRSKTDHDWCLTITEGLAAATGRHEVFGAVISSEVNDPPPRIAVVAQANDLALLRGARAGLAALSSVAGWRPRSPALPPEHSGVLLDDLLSPGSEAGPMSEHDSALVLERYGVSFAPRCRAADPAEAARVAVQLGFPVVVKVDGPTHKSAAGGVVLGLCNPGEVEEAARRLGGPLLVATQVLGGIEVICGMQRDRTFGPIVLCGLGGALAEAAGHVATALAPLDTARAGELVDSVPGLAHAVAPEARWALIDLLLGLSALAVEHEDIEAVDVNPVIVSSGEAVAVDALVVFTGSGRSGSWT